MSIEELLKEKQEEIRRIAEKHGAKDVRVFGSRARGEAGPDSDVDLLVDTGPETSPWFPAGLVLDLEEILGCKVEVVTQKGLSAYLRERVLREARPL
jgi:hypothetical protein